jgi:hypothetical protein
MEEKEKEVIKEVIKKEDRVEEKEIVRKEDRKDKKKPEVQEVLYKMDMFLPNGTIRSNIPKGVLHMLGRDWGDIMRCVPSHRWSTMEDIVNLVWDFENKSYLKSFNRTRKQIEEGVQAAVEAGVILTK